MGIEERILDPKAGVADGGALLELEPAGRSDRGVSSSFRNWSLFIVLFESRNADIESVVVLVFESREYGLRDQTMQVTQSRDMCQAALLVLSDTFSVVSSTQIPL